jgi:hypothetical protein
MAQKRTSERFGYLAFLADPIIWALVIGGIFGCAAARASFPLVVFIIIAVWAAVWLWVAQDRTKPSQ